MFDRASESQIPPQLPSLKLAPVETWFGQQTLIAYPATAILNSRQNKYPAGNEPWIRQTIQAAAHACRNEYAVIAGIGLKTWELSLWAASEALGNVVALVGVPPGASTSEILGRLVDVRNDFRLVKQNALLIPYFESDSRSPKSDWLARDSWILHHARLLLPVSIREDGFFSAQLKRERFKQQLDSSFSIDYSPGETKFHAPPDSETVLRSLKNQGITSWDWLTHWTRISEGPWPGETSADYYETLSRGQNSCPRSALDTLRHILAENRVRGSSWRMPGSTGMVSFTALPPWDIVQKMTWRKRFVRPLFEPYGIAIRKSTLEAMGTRAVQYGPPEHGKTLPAQDRLYFQTSSESSPWPLEKEWRLKGDLDLGSIPGKDLLILVRDESSRKQVQQEFPYHIVALEKS